MSGAPGDERRVAAFFYGSFMRREVLSRGGYELREFEVARLPGFDIHVSPRAGLSRSDRHSVYGILARLTHAELGRLYSMPGVDVFLPEAVLVETRDGKLQPALCYLPAVLDDKPADREYLGHLVRVAREYAFPEWYITRLAGMP